MQMQLQRRPSGLPDWLYVAIVAALGLYFVIGAIAWATFIYNGIPGAGFVRHDPCHHCRRAGRRACAECWPGSVL
jgi:hypothetical protein